MSVQVRTVLPAKRYEIKINLKASQFSILINYMVNSFNQKLPTNRMRKCLEVLIMFCPKKSRGEQEIIKFNAKDLKFMIYV